MKKWINWLIFAVVGVVLALGAFIFNLWILPLMVNYQVGKTMALENGTFVWNVFIDTPVPMYLKVYFFNIENPEGLARGEKPRVKEIGPYVYRETRKKHDVRIDYEKDTVFYHQGMTFTFDAAKSHPLKDDDELVLINFPYHLTSQIVKSLEYPFSLVDEVVELALPEILGKNSSGTTIKVSVKNMLFDGVVLTCKSNNASVYAKIICSALNSLLNKMIVKAEDGNIIAALLRYKNTTYDGLFEINRGVKDFSSIGKIVSWENKTKQSAWNGDYCNRIVGSYDMTLFPPFVNKDTTFRLYSTDLCTTAPVEYVGETDFKGITSLRFSLSPKFMGNISKYHDNSCYAPGSIRNLTLPGEYPPVGTINVASCLDLPAFLSYPHLLHASPYYQSLVDGLHPDPRLHDTFMDLEPTTGVPLRGYRRFQMNILTTPNSAIHIFKNISNALVPLLWFEEGAEVGDSQISMIRDQLLTVLKVADIIKWVLIGCGLCMALIGIIMSIWKVRQRHYHPD